MVNEGILHYITETTNYRVGGTHIKKCQNVKYGNILEENRINNIVYNQELRSCKFIIMRKLYQLADKSCNYLP